MWPNNKTKRKKKEKDHDRSGSKYLSNIQTTKPLIYPLELYSEKSSVQDVGITSPQMVSNTCSYLILHSLPERFRVRPGLKARRLASHPLARHMSTFPSPDMSHSSHSYLMTQEFCDQLWSLQLVIFKGSQLCDKRGHTEATEKTSSHFQICALPSPRQRQGVISCQE